MEAKGQDICNRTRAFALRIVKVHQALGGDSTGRILGQQLLKAGTSIGANVEEAQAGQSKSDFIAKMSIALKEARETRYWLTLIIEANLLPAKRLDAVLTEIVFIEVLWAFLED